MSEDEATELGAHGVVVIDEPLRQGFSTCIGPEHPVFVTRDRRLMLFRQVERGRTPTRAEWNFESEKVPRPAWMDPIPAAPAPAKGK